MNTEKNWLKEQIKRARNDMKKWPRWVRKSAYFAGVQQNDFVNVKTKPSHDSSVK